MRATAHAGESVRIEERRLPQSRSVSTSDPPANDVSRPPGPAGPPDFGCRVPAAARSSEALRYQSPHEAAVAQFHLTHDREARGERELARHPAEDARYHGIDEGLGRGPADAPGGEIEHRLVEVVAPWRDEGFGEDAQLVQGAEQAGAQHRGRREGHRVQTAPLHDEPLFASVVRPFQKGVDPRLPHQLQGERFAVEEAVGSPVKRVAVDAVGAYSSPHPPGRLPQFPASRPLVQAQPVCDCQPRNPSANDDPVEHAVNLSDPPRRK